MPVCQSSREKACTQWALTKEEMKNCVWLKPQLVAQIEFTEWTPDGHLRHSKFVEIISEILKYLGLDGDAAQTKAK